MIEVLFILLLFANIIVILYKIANKYNKLPPPKYKCLQCHGFMLINKWHMCDACYEDSYLRYYNS